MALASLFLWSLAPPFSKIGVGEIGYISFSFWTAVAAALLALPLFAQEGGLAMAQRHWRQLALLALCSYILFTITYFLAMEQLSGIQGSALLGTEILFSLGLGAWAGKERLDLRNVLFSLALVFGVAVVVTNGAFVFLNPAAMLLGVLSLFFIQLGYYLAPDALRECGPGTLLVPGMLSLALVSALLGVVVGGQAWALPSGGAALLTVLGFALLPVVVSYVCFYGALKKIGIYRTTAIVVPAPAVSLLFSAVMLGEAITIANLLGMTLIALSVVKITEANEKRKEKRKMKGKAALS